MTLTQELAQALRVALPYAIARRSKMRLEAATVAKDSMAEVEADVVMLESVLARYDAEPPAIDVPHACICNQAGTCIYCLAGELLNKHFGPDGRRLLAEPPASRGSEGEMFAEAKPVAYTSSHELEMICGIHPDYGEYQVTLTPSPEGSFNIPLYAETRNVRDND